jgi:hypothetical protein
VECFVMTTCFQAFRAKILTRARPDHVRRRSAFLIITLLLFYCAVFFGIDHLTVLSFRP